MPGTIQVSVLGLMDLPPSGQPSSTSSSKGCLSSLFSLKIAMGKTEYQTGGKGDFFFPVTSPRENLKLTLLDANGNVISRTDVKTMVVVEKRFWDALFPLEGGGCVHLKLQFILNAEEHRRIREMREAVLKRRHVGRGKKSVASLSQDLPQQPEHHHEQDAICQSKANEEASGYQVNQNDIHEVNVSLEETLDPQLRCSGSIVSEEIVATSNYSSAMAQEEGKVKTSKESAHGKYPVSNTKKLISAFENNSVQEPRIHLGPTTESWMRRVKRGDSLGSRVKIGDSLGSPWSEEMNTEKVAIRKMMPKSFSTGALPQMKSAPFGLPYVKVQEEEKHTEFAIGKKNLGSIKQSVESKNVKNYEKLDPGSKKAVSEFFCAAEPPCCERSSDTSETMETKGVINFCRLADMTKNVDQHPSHKTEEGPPITFQIRSREHEEFMEKIGLGSFREGVFFLDSEASYGNLDVTDSLCSEKERNMLGYKDHVPHKINKGNNKMVEGPSVRGEHLGGYHESFAASELVHANEIRKDEAASTKDSMISRKVVPEPAITEQLSSLSMHQGQPKPSIIKAQSGFSSSRDDVYELTTCGSLNVKLDMLTLLDAEQCLLGSHGNSMHRHLCITSGSKQLKDIVGGFISI